MFLASSVRASEEQFPHLYQMMLDGCYILDLPTVPELYISQDPIVQRDGARARTSRSS